MEQLDTAIIEACQRGKVSRAISGQCLDRLAKSPNTGSRYQAIASARAAYGVRFGRWPLKSAGGATAWGSIASDSDAVAATAYVTATP